MVPPRFGAANICQDPRDYGDGSDNVLEYYFNTERNQCEAFYYSGSGGNGNRFSTSEQCERQCGQYRGIGKNFFDCPQLS